MSSTPRPGLDLDRLRRNANPAPSGVAGSPTLGLVDKERRVREILASLETLPSLPDVVARVLQLTNDTQAGAGDFEEIVRKDQALTAKVLKLVNSPFFGVKSQVATIPQAIVVLGFKTLKSVVLAAKTSNLLNQQLDSYGFEPGGMWKHSIACADICQRLAARLDLSKECGEQLFIAGLLHDVGKVILAPFILPEREAFRRTMENTAWDTIATEESVLGISHADIGGRMVEKWNLTPRLRGVIASHHVFQLPGGDRDVDVQLAVVQLADALCDGKGVGRLPGAKPPVAQYAALLETLGLTDDQAEVEAEADRAIEGMAAVVEAMGGGDSVS